jgi:hypothetical protein
MKKLTILMVVLVLAFSFFEGGCSWIRWSHNAPPEIPGMKIECSAAAPTVDTVGTAVFAGAALGVGLHKPECSEWAMLCGAEEFIVAVSLGAVAVIWSAASISGWVNYHHCRAYQERVSLDKKLNTSPELFKPAATPTDAPEGSSP